MPHLHQLKVKLLDLIKKPDVTNSEIEEVIDEIFYALGGCDKCEGRGYLMTTGKFCDCDRGQRLREFTNALPKV
jgi:hypothetical protein